MPVTNKEFSLLISKISIGDTTLNKLKEAADVHKSYTSSLKSKINNQYINSIKTLLQGSYKTSTLVKPRDAYQSIDIDLGIYLYADLKYQYGSNHLKNIVHELWPDRYRFTLKNKCNRYFYSDNTVNYHIDIVTYWRINTQSLLATKGEGFIKSYPEAFSKWFIEKNKESDNQIREFVKILKYWKNGLPKKALSGFCFSILVAKCFPKSQNTDKLINLIKCCENICLYLEKNEYKVFRPTYPTNYNANTSSIEQTYYTITELKKLIYHFVQLSKRKVICGDIFDII